MMNVLTKRIASITLNDRKASFIANSINSASNSPHGSLHFRSFLKLNVSNFSSKRIQKTASPTNFITDSSGRRFSLADLSPGEKLKPKVIRRRLEKLRTYEGKEKGIRHSPWRLQLICRHVAGLPLQEALTQLEFLNKVKAPLVQKVLKRTSNLADIRDGLQPSQLEVAECFATHGQHLKRMKMMGRGRSGVMHHRFSHMRLVLREIDFPLKIYTAKTVGEKKRLLENQLIAQADYEAAKAERDELQRLERTAALKEKERETEK